MRPDPALLPPIVRALLGEYAARGVSSWDVGNGHCEDFAMEALRRWAGDGFREGDGSPGGEGFQTLETLELLAPGDDGPPRWDWDLLARRWGVAPPPDVDAAALDRLAELQPGHFWIAAGGRHYDADAPDGVASFLDLPFFRRWLGLRDGVADRDAARAALPGRAA